MTRRTWIARLFVAAAATGVAVAMTSGSANAGLLPVSVTVQPEAGNFRWTYSVVLPTNMQLQSGNYFTIYDFAGYQAGSGTVTATSPDPSFSKFWTLSTSLLGPTPDRLNPQDDPNLTNLTFTYTGPTIPSGQMTLGNFSAVSAFGTSVAELLHRHQPAGPEREHRQQHHLHAGAAGLVLTARGRHPGTGHARPGRPRHAAHRPRPLPPPQGPAGRGRVSDRTEVRIAFTEPLGPTVRGFFAGVRLDPAITTAAAVMSLPLACVCAVRLPCRCRTSRSGGVVMRWVPAGLVAVLLALPAFSSPADPVPKDPPRTVDELAADLGHPAFAVREKAQRELWERGEGAIPALEKAAKGDDPEAARRAREVLDKFAWGVRPDTPPAVLKLIRQFQAGDPNPERADTVRKEAVAELLKKGRPGVSVVRAILRKDLPVESREKLTATVTALVRHEVPLLLVAGKTDEADELISLHAAGTTPEGAADFAAYHVLRGDLPAATARAEAAGARPGARPPTRNLFLRTSTAPRACGRRHAKPPTDCPTRRKRPPTRSFCSKTRGTGRRWRMRRLPAS